MDATVPADFAAGLARNWDLPAAARTAPDRSALLDALTARVKHLLRSDFQRLVTAMYTLDISEARFRTAVEGDEAAAARRIAELILDRELEKARTRAQYATHPRNSRDPHEPKPLPKEST